MADVLAQKIMCHHIDQMSRSINSIFDRHEQLNFQLYSDRTLVTISEAAMMKFCQEPTLLEINGPLVVVGDIHGHILDLYRIFTKYDLPPATKYLFLGDIVDRGPFGIESLFLILSLKILYPRNIYLIRGNHEFKEMTTKCGFLEEIEEMYEKSTLVYESILNCFKYIPLCAKVGQIICVHGGLDPSLHSISQIKQYPRPISEYTRDIIEGILWSDPAKHDAKDYIKSHRGHGYEFGENVLTEFLKNNNLVQLIRGHECVDGIKAVFHDKVLTVFSASNYVSANNNQSGVILINEKNHSYPMILPRIPFLTRRMVKFIPITSALGSSGVLERKERLKRFETQYSSSTRSQSIFKNQTLERKKIRKRINSIPDLDIFSSEGFNKSNFPSLLTKD